MCLAKYAEILEVGDGSAVVSYDGARRDVSMMLVDGYVVGDYVLVHAGFAIGGLEGGGEALEKYKNS